MYPTLVTTTCEQYENPSPLTIMKRLLTGIVVLRMARFFRGVKAVPELQYLDTWRVRVQEGSCPNFTFYSVLALGAVLWTIIRIVWH
jgi:hypothetical protein